MNADSRRRVRRARCRAAAAAARARRSRPAPRRTASSPDPARSPASARFADTGKIAGSGTIAARCWRAKRQRLRQLRLVEQIRLRHHEDQPVARRAQDPLLEELPLRRGQDLRRVQQEDRRVGARQVAVGDLGALLVDVVDARRVDDRQLVRQQRRRVGDLDVVDRRPAFACRRLAFALVLPRRQPLDGQPIRQRAPRRSACARRSRSPPSPPRARRA